MWNNVEHPSHYTYGKIETIEVIEDWELNYNIGNAIKYLWRYKHKYNPVEDLDKAIWYIIRERDAILAGDNND